MSRELNRNLFQNTIAPNSESSQTSVVITRESESLNQDQIRKLALELTQVKRQMQEVESRMEASDNRFREHTQLTKRGLERLQNGLQMLEKTVKGHIQDLSGKLSLLKGRFAERKASDAKIEDLIGRHNQMVQTFEVRLTQLQKLINEQEMRLLGYKSILKDLQNK